MHTPEILRKLRHERNLTQQQVADMLHVERSTYAYVESGRIRLSIEVLVKLARFYQVSPCEILDEQFSCCKNQPNESPRHWPTAH